MSASPWSLSLEDTFRLSEQIKNTILTVDQSEDLVEANDYRGLTGLWAGLVVDVLTSRINDYRDVHERWVCEAEREANLRGESREWIQTNIYDRYVVPRNPAVYYVPNEDQYIWEYHDHLETFNGTTGNLLDSYDYLEPATLKDIEQLCIGDPGMINTVAYTIFRHRCAQYSQLFNGLSNRYHRVEFNLWLRRIPELPALNPLDGVVLAR